MEGPLSDRERWDRRYASGSHADAAKPDWLDAFEAELPERGPALDLATGTGPVARWLARRGLDVLAVDVSPEGLRLARDRARGAGLALETLVLDLEREPLPQGPWSRSR